MTIRHQCALSCNKCENSCCPDASYLGGGGGPPTTPLSWMRASIKHSVYASFWLGCLSSISQLNPQGNVFAPAVNTWKPRLTEVTCSGPMPGIPYTADLVPRKQGGVIDHSEVRPRICVFAQL